MEEKPQQKGKDLSKQACTLHTDHIEKLDHQKKS